jgi:hypothetical protein
MAVLVVNHGIIKSISILTLDIHPMRKCDVNIPLELLPAGTELDAGHLLSAFDTLCFGFESCTPLYMCSATRNKFFISARMESMNSKRSVSDSK